MKFSITSQVEFMFPTVNIELSALEFNDKNNSIHEKLMEIPNYDTLYTALDIIDKKYNLLDSVTVRIRLNGWNIQVDGYSGDVACNEASDYEYATYDTLGDPQNEETRHDNLEEAISFLLNKEITNNASFDRPIDLEPVTQKENGGEEEQTYVPAYVPVELEPVIQKEQNEGGNVNQMNQFDPKYLAAKAAEKAQVKVKLDAMKQQLKYQKIHIESIEESDASWTIVLKDVGMVHCGEDTDNFIDTCIDGNVQRHTYALSAIALVCQKWDAIENPGTIVGRMIGNEIVFNYNNKKALQYLECDLDTGEVYTVLAWHSVAKDWFENNNYQYPMVIVKFSQDDEYRATERYKELVHKIIYEGINAWIPVRLGSNVSKRVHFETKFATPSQIRQDAAIFMDENVIDKFIYMATAGTDLSALHPAKKAQYTTLMLSTTTKWSKMYPHITVPKFTKAWIGKDLKMTEKLQVWKWNEQLQTYERVMEDIEHMLSDGEAIVIIHDIGMSYEEVQALMKSKELRAGSLRYPGTKVSFQFVMESALVRFLKHYGKTELEPDMYGRVYGIGNMPDIIMFGSGFKFSKVIDTKEKMDQFIANCDELGHEFSVCITEHNSPKDIPYQTLICLDMGLKEGKFLSQMAYDTIEPYFDEKACAIIGGSLGKAIELFKPLLGDCLATETWYTAMHSWKHRLYGGRMPKEAKYHILSQDMFALLQHVAGIKKITGLIPKGYAICQHHEYKEGCKMATYRMPNCDNNSSILINWKPPKEWRDLYIGTSIFISIYGGEMLLKQADFDGDKLGVIVNPEIVSLVETAIQKQGNIPLLLNETDPGGTKDRYTDDDFKDFLYKLCAAPIGLCANAMVKMRCFGNKHSADYLNTIFAASDGVTNAVDRAKHPTKADDGGEEATKTSENIIKEMNPFLHHQMFEGILKGMKMPRFNAWGKTKAFNYAALGERLNTTKFASQNGVELYCALLRQKLEGRVGMNESKVVLKQPVVWKNNKVSEAVGKMLCKDGKFCRVAGLSEFFDKICATAVEEYTQVAKTCGDNLNRLEAQSAWTEEYIKSASTYFVAQTVPGASDEEILQKTVSALACNCYTKGNDYKSKNIKRIFWRIFGNKILDNLKENIKNHLWETLSVDFGEEIQNACVELPPENSSEDALYAAMAEEEEYFTTGCDEEMTDE